MDECVASQWTRLEALFIAGLACPASQRRDFVERACADDAALRRTLSAMLDGDAAARARLEQVVADAVGAMEPPVAGRTIGPFRVLSLIGRGGMGAVYLGERDGNEFHQRVAIKVLQHGVASPQLVARFRDERRILARLEHPGIVRLVDGGSTAEGLPYLVMEHVDGTPLATYARALTLKARVELVARICAPLQYAHDHLVVHRDLKPGNILVTAEGTPKLLDFGIAKLLAPDPVADPDREATTRTGIAIMTPEYASPEQARGDPVSAASDVYSLGAVFYELLVGHPPQRPGATVLETLRAIVEDDPPRPSAVAPPTLRRHLRGELDNIVMKALQKRTQDRYPSVAAFADDLERYLSGHAVRAHAATLGYRARKFARRHRGALAITTVVAIALTTATVVSIVQAGRASASAARARRDALALLVEQGRQQLLDGHADRALPYLVEARQRGAHGASLSVLLAEATRAAERERVTGDAIPAGIAGVAWSPDSRRFVITGHRGAVRTYDATGQLLATLDDEEAGRLTRPVWSQDGRWLAASGDDGRVWIWDVLASRHTATVDAAIQPDAGDRTPLAFTADGTLVTCAADGTARLWGPATGALTREFPPAVGAGPACAIAGDGTAMVAGTVVRRLPDGATLRVLAHHGATTSAVMSAHAASALVRSDAEVTLWDLTTGRLTLRLPAELFDVRAASFSSDGRRLVAVGTDRATRVWDARTGRVVSVLRGTHQHGLARFSNDGQRLVTLDASTFRLIDAATAAVETELTTVPAPSNEPHALAVAVDAAFAADDQSLLTATGTRFSIWNADRSPLRDVLATGALTGVALAADGATVATSGMVGAGAIWSLDEHRRISEPVETKTYDADWSRDGMHVAWAGEDGFVVVAAPDGRHLRAFRGHLGIVNSVAFDAAGTRIATGGDDRTARIWNLDGTPGPILAHPHRVLGVAWSRDDRWLATAGWDGTLRLWDATTGELLRAIDGGPVQFLEVAFGPDDRWLIAGGHAGEVTVWSIATGVRIANYEGHTGPVTAARFSPDGALVATSADDQTARVWDAATGTELVRRGHDYAVMQLRWSADGQRLYTAGADGFLRVWEVTRDARPPAVLAQVLARHGHWRLASGRLERR